MLRAYFVQGTMLDPVARAQRRVRQNLWFREGKYAQYDKTNTFLLINL